MHHTVADWNSGTRTIADLGQWRDAYPYREEYYVSPDGERIAAVVQTSEMVEEPAYGICENGALWETPFDNIFYLRYLADGRLFALVQDTGEWTVAVDGTTWENRYEFAWNPQFSVSGQQIVIATQNARKYAAALNDTPWENEFGDISHLTISADGRSSAGVVQTVSFSEGDIYTFQEGCYTVAVNGRAWDSNFVNAFDPAFSTDAQRVAAGVRTSLYEYTVVVDGAPWTTRYAGLWAPLFSPLDQTVTVPVSQGGKWFLARDGQIIWDTPMTQVWHHQYSPDGRHIAAIVAPTFGRWTIARDGTPWKTTFSDVVTDLVFSPDGSRIACAAKDRDYWKIVVEGQAWPRQFDRVWSPVFNPKGSHLAAKVQSGKRYAVMLDNRAVAESETMLWEPVFSPDGQKLLLRFISPEGQYCRQVLALSNH